MQDPGSLSVDLDNFSSSHSRVTTESNSENKRLQLKLTTRPQTLIVVDFSVKDGRRMCSKKTKILCFAKNMISDMTERILHVVATHPTVKNIIVHIGANDVVKQQSEVLKLY